jgi:hypothetical protein
MLRKIFELKFLRFFFVIILLVIQGELQASNDYFTIKNLKEDWLIYEKNEDTFLPFVENYNSTSITSLGFFLNGDVFQGKQLLLEIPRKTTLKINNKVIKHFSSSIFVNYSIDSLINVYGSVPFISFYNSNFDVSSFRSEIISYDEKYMALKSESGINYFEIIKKHTDHLRNFYVLGHLMFFVILAILFSSFRRFWKDYYNAGRAFSIKVRDDGFYKLKILTSVNLLFLFFLSLVMSYLLLSLFSMGGFDGLSILDWTSGHGTLKSWAILSFGVLSIFIMKYYFIYMWSSIFLINDFKKIHFYDSTRMTIIFCSIIMCLFAIYYLNINAFGQLDLIKWMIPVVIIFLVFRTIIIFFKLINLYPYRKLHLFSYLCTTEIIPLLIGLKIILK